MMVHAIFHGGNSYSTNWTVEDVETFNSLNDAKEIFRYRTDNQDKRYPVTDESAEMMIFYLDPREPDDKRIRVGNVVLICDLMPDKILKRGPHGGVSVNPA